MIRLYYKGIGESIKPPEREKRISMARSYLKDNRYLNDLTGEIITNYPSICYDNGEARRVVKESNRNSYAHRLMRLLGDDAVFSTVNLYDIHPTWGHYDAIFDPIRTVKIKSYLSRTIKGPYMAGLEIGGFNGAHAHIISFAQGGRKQFKAVRPIYDYFGLIEYISKSAINPDDRYERPEDYELMIGTYLEWKGMMGRKRLPRRTVTRLKL